MMECASPSLGYAGAGVAAALQYFAAAQCLLGEPWPKNAHVTNGSTFEVVVAGGGSGGAALAARLASSGVRVLLLEVGGDPPVEAVIPGYKDTMKGSAYDWNYRTVNDGVSSQGLKGGSYRVPRGRMLGGSGSLNDMIYVRGDSTDYDWGLHWTWDEVLPHFMRLENMTDERIVNNPVLMREHGTGGAIEVTGRNATGRHTQLLLDAFVELGFSLEADMTKSHPAGTGRFSRAVSNGRRSSSLTALLNDAAAGDNLFVIKQARVIRVLIENSTAYGVVALIDGEQFHFYASLEVVVSAGVYNTPQLLMLSGIGPKQHLQEIGVPVLVDLPVGDNLHDHTMVMMYLVAERGTCEADPAARHMDVIRYLYDRSGDLALPETMGAYLTFPDARMPGANETQEREAHFGFYPTCVPVGGGFYSGCSDFLGLPSSYCRRLDDLNQHMEIISVAVVLLNPKSRGRVRLNSTDPLALPLIYSGTFSDEEDLKWYPGALEVVRSIADTTYFRSKHAKPVELELRMCGGGWGDEPVRCVTRATVQSAWHGGGTAALGSVLDVRLRVRGVRGLRVADASALPRSVRGNTDAPTVMLADRAAMFILEDHAIIRS